MLFASCLPVSQFRQRSGKNKHFTNQIVTNSNVSPIAALLPTLDTDGSFAAAAPEIHSTTFGAISCTMIVTTGLKWRLTNPGQQCRSQTRRASGGHQQRPAIPSYSHYRHCHYRHRRPERWGGVKGGGMWRLRVELVSVCL